MSDSNPQVLVNIAIYKFDSQGRQIGDQIVISGKLVESFEYTLYDGLAPSALIIRLVDYTWELSQSLNLYNINRGDVLRVVFSFGHTSSVWSSLSGIEEPAMTPNMLGTITKFLPTFSQSGIEITITSYSIAMEQVMKTVYGTYAIPSGITSLSEVYTTICDYFGISLSIDGKLDGIKVSDASDNKVDHKRTNESGLDYLARIFLTYPPTINGKPTFGRFNPFANDGKGSFEIKPDGVQFIKRIYRYNGLDSRIVEFTPTIDPTILEKRTETSQFSVVNLQTKERTVVATPDMATTDIQKSQLAYKTEEVLRATVTNIENSYFRDVLGATLKIIADINLFRGDLVQIEVYNKLNGTLILAKAYFVIGLVHSMEDGILYTSMQLSPAYGREAIISKISETADAAKREENDNIIENSFKSISEEFSKITGYATNFIDGILG